MRAFAASGSFAFAAKAAEKTVTRCNSAGSGPTMSISSIGRSSLNCWKPISASPASNDRADAFAQDLTAGDDLGAIFQAWNTSVER